MQKKKYQNAHSHGNVNEKEVQQQNASNNRILRSNYAFIFRCAAFKMHFKMTDAVLRQIHKLDLLFIVVKCL